MKTLCESVVCVVLLVAQCGAFIKRFTNNTGTIESPNYPNQYPHNEKQLWDIIVSSEKRIRLQFTRFRLENHAQCSYDYVEVTSKGGSSGWTNHGKFCGAELPDVITSVGNHMQIEFKSDSSNSDIGFTANYTTVCEPDRIACPTGKCILRSFVCDGDNDCGDNWDERNCTGSTSTICASNRHACPSGKCISMSYLCDGDDDCGDLTDEMQCKGCNNSVTQKFANGRFENCTSPTTYPHGAELVPHCHKGYKLQSRATIKCKNGSWNDVPLCTAFCEITKLPAGIKVQHWQSEYYVKNTTELACTHGYFTSGPYPSSILTISCIGPDTWNQTNLQCLPASDFVYFYRPEKESIVDTDLDLSVTLDCLLVEKSRADEEDGVLFPLEERVFAPLEKDWPIVTEDKDYSASTTVPPLNTTATTTTTSTNTTTTTEWLWLKDQMEIDSIEGINFTIASNGSLTLRRIGAQAEGMYSCFAKNHTLYNPGGTVYNLRLKSSCVAVNYETVNLTVTEGGSAVFFCPYYDPKLVHPPVWYDPAGKRVWKSKRFNVVASGGLFIAEVRPTDEGLYTCESPTDTPYCERNFTVRVHVNLLQSSSCGKVDSSEEHPWLVKIGWSINNQQQVCYGVLISNRFVLSASTCIRPNILSGDVKLFVYSDNSDSFLEIESSVTHPQAGTTGSSANLVLLKLKQAIPQSSRLKAICISKVDFLSELGKTTQVDPCTNVKPIHLPAFAAGWGPVNYIKQTSSVNRITLVKDIVSCPKEAENGTLCTRISNVDDPSGDLGSPLQVGWYNQVYIYGVVSEVKKLVGSQVMYHFTQISRHYDWIMSAIKQL